MLGLGALDESEGVLHDLCAERFLLEFACIERREGVELAFEAVLIGPHKLSEAGKQLLSAVLELLPGEEVPPLHHDVVDAEVLLVGLGLDIVELLLMRHEVLLVELVQVILQVNVPAEGECLLVESH